MSDLIFVLVAMVWCAGLLAFNLSVDGRRDLPTLNKVAMGLDIITVITLVVIITAKGWWC